MSAYIIGLIALATACTSKDSIADKSKLLSGDYRLFKDTPAWELAKAVEKEDTDKIRFEISKDKHLLDLREERFGQTILSLAIINTDYTSTKLLLELGADPNLQNFDDGDSPLMEAVNIGGNISFAGVDYQSSNSDSRFLKLLLKHGGKPNDEQRGPGLTRMTPLLYACQKGNLEYVKILINAGANVNATNQYGQSPLGEAAIQEFPDVVIFLINNGANFKQELYKTVPEGESKYLTDALRFWRFDLDSEEFKKKTWLVDFLKKNGIDYKKAKIPEHFFRDYSKEYLEKY